MMKRFSGTGCFFCFVVDVGKIFLNRKAINTNTVDRKEEAEGVTIRSNFISNTLHKKTRANTLSKNEVYAFLLYQ